MNRSITSWYSPALDAEMPVVTYGHYGFALILIPTAAADFLEYEGFQHQQHQQRELDARYHGSGAQSHPAQPVQ
jgi:esterase/lipase superfamily enzyme